MAMQMILVTTASDLQRGRNEFPEGIACGCQNQAPEAKPGSRIEGVCEAGGEKVSNKSQKDRKTRISLRLNPKKNFPVTTG